MEHVQIGNPEREIKLDPDFVGKKLLGIDKDSQLNFLKPEFCDLFDKSSESWNITITQARSMKPEEITEMITRKDLDLDTNINRLRVWEYIHLYRFIVTSNDESNWNTLPEQDKHTLAKVQNEAMNILHKNVNISLRSYLQSQKSEDATIKLKLLEENEKHEEANLGNIKVFRGLYCNANCLMCFQENSANEEVDRFVKANRKLEYTSDQLTRALLYGRAAYRLREVSFTGGESLVNKPKLFAGDVALAKEMGYPQISTMSNGRLMDKEQLQLLVESGLSHVILSIHTVDPLTHFKILNWKDARRPIFQTVTEEAGNLDSPTKTQLIKSMTQKFLETGDKVDLPEELKEIAEVVEAKIKEKVVEIYDQIIQNIREAVKFNKTHGTKVRLNMAYSPTTIGTDLRGIVDFAQKLGVHEVTLVEMIPGNETATSMHTPLPGDGTFRDLGYQPQDNRNWQVGGIKIYQKEGSPTFATCNFGQLNQLTMAEGDDQQFANFSGQTKEVILQPDGVLSTATYAKDPILYWS